MGENETRISDKIDEVTMFHDDDDEEEEAKAECLPAGRCGREGLTTGVA